MTYIEINMLRYHVELKEVNKMRSHVCENSQYLQENICFSVYIEGLERKISKCI